MVWKGSNFQNVLREWAKENHAKILKHSRTRYKVEFLLRIADALAVGTLKVCSQ